MRSLLVPRRSILPPGIRWTSAALLAALALLDACAIGDDPGGTGGASDAGGSPGIGGAGSGGTTGGGGRGAGGATGVGGTGAGGTTGAGGSPGTGGQAGASSSGSGGSGSGGAAGSGATHWVGTWTGAPQLTETANLPPVPLSNATLRQVVHVSLGGSRVRVRFSNEFGNGPVIINQAHLAVSPANPVNSTIDVASDRALSFSGAASTVIATGQATWSDAVDFEIATLGNLAITVAFGAVPSNVTGHPGSRTTSYLQASSSNLTAASMSTAQTADHWYIVSAVDVMAPTTTNGLVILGDSITDGRGSTTNGNDRWPDALARRLVANQATARVAVMNQGIGGNTVTTGGLGPTAVSRFTRDVLGQSGVHWILILEGVNDIGGNVGAPAITAAFASFISQAHARNLLIYGATITPFGANAYYTPAHETARQAVNTYVRSGAFDGFIDMDAAVRDSSAPPKLQAAYDSGDSLHLNPAGYRAMADAVDLTLFTR